MKSHLIKFAIVLAAFFSMLSCGGGTKTAKILDDVAGYIQDAPDSALAAIRSIDTLDLITARMRAKYSLLHAMALDKNYIDTTNVSIVMPAVRYYERHGNAGDKLKALYYLGRIQYNAGAHYEAMSTFTKALQYADEADDKKYVGMLYAVVGVEYRKNTNHEEALPYFEKAYECMKDVPGLESYSSKALYDLASAYYSVLQIDKAESIFREMMNDGQLSTSMKAAVSSHLALIWLSAYGGKEAESVELFETALNNGAGLAAQQWGAYAYALGATGQKAKSDAIFDRLLSSSDSLYIASGSFWRSRVEEKDGRYKEAYEDYKSAMQFKENDLRKALYQSMARAQKDYFEAQSLAERSRAEVRRFYYLTAILALIIALFLITATFIRRSRRILAEKDGIAELADLAELQLREAEKKTDALLSQLNDRECALAGLKAEYARMYKDKFSYLSRLCEAYYTADNYKEPSAKVYSQVKEMIADIRSDKKGQKHFEKMIDRDLDNIMTHFREDFPMYGEDDYRFVSYIFVGFDTVTLMAIFQMPSSGSVYMKKSRMKKAIMESGSQYREQYLRMFA